MNKVLKSINMVIYNISQEDSSDCQENVSSSLSDIVNNLKRTSSLEDYSIELTSLNMVYKFIKNECPWKRLVTEDLENAISDLTQIVYLKYKRLHF